MLLMMSLLRTVVLFAISCHLFNLVAEPDPFRLPITLYAINPLHFNSPNFTSFVLLLCCFVLTCYNCNFIATTTQQLQPPTGWSHGRRKELQRGQIPQALAHAINSILSSSWYLLFFCKYLANALPSCSSCVLYILFLFLATKGITIFG